MRRTYAYFISLLVIISPQFLDAQDTVSFPLKIRAGIDLAGPVSYFQDKSNMSFEGYLSYDRNEKLAYVVEGGYLKYKYSQWNYDYTANGIFLRAGTDINLLKPQTSSGKYWVGVGLRYGVSIFSSETPLFKHENYWGTVTSSIPSRNSMGHFLEIDPGMRAEIFRNCSIGWSIRLRLLISGGGGKDLPPVYLPGFGTGGSNTSAGINYYLVWSIPYKTKTVITKKEAPPEEEETGDQSTTQQSEGLKPQQ
jgi:hypothetical protein